MYIIDEATKLLDKYITFPGKRLFEVTDYCFYQIPHYYENIHCRREVLKLLSCILHEKIFVKQYLSLI